MKNLLYVLFIAVVSLPAMAPAADFDLFGTTLLQFEERADPGFEKKTLLPATLFLGAEADNLLDGNLSLHAYGWGRVDLDNKSTVGGKTADGNLAYAFLKYRFPRANGQIRLGRFFVYEGVAAEQVDGVSASVDLAKGFGFSMFGGTPVKPEYNSDGKGDYIVGGRVSYRYKGKLEFGLSALREGEVKTGPLIALKNNRDMAGGDIWLSPHRMVDVRGHTFYNIATKGIAEHSYLMNIRPTEMLTVFGEFNENRFEDYFASTNLRSLFNPDVGDKVKIYGVGIIVAASQQVEITADYRHYRRETTGNANVFGAGARLTLLDNKFRSGFSYRRSDSPAEINSYHELRGFGMYDAGMYFASLDVIADFYDHKIYNKDLAFEAIASLGFRPTSYLTVSGDISYGQNPLLTDEVKGLLRLSFNFTTKNQGAKK